MNRFIFSGVITVALFLLYKYLEVFEFDFLSEVAAFLTIFGALLLIKSEFLKKQEIKESLYSFFEFYKKITNRIRLRYFNKLIFLGREKELDLINNLCKFEFNGPKVIYFYSFAGVGKTYLLNHIFAQKWANHNYFVHSFKGENFVSVTYRAFPSISHKRKYSTQYEILNHLAKSIHNKTLILIDEYQFDNEDYNDEVNYFLTKLSLFKKHVLLIVAARECPVIKNDYFEFHKLHGFSEEEIFELINKKWNKKKIYKELIHNIDLIAKVTNGNPKLIEYICGNDEVWADISKEKDIRLCDSQSINKFFFEIWKRVETKDPAFCEQLKYLATISFVTEIWDDKICNLVFNPIEWVVLKHKLIRKSLLESYDNGKYKFHDLFSQFIYDLLPDNEKMIIHKKLYHCYKNHYSSHNYSYMSFKHALYAKNIYAAYTTYKKNKELFLRCNYLFVTVEHLEKLLEIDPTVDDNISVDILNDIGYCYSMIGKYSKALEIFDTITEKFKNSISDKNVFGEIICRKAFVTHSLGNFQQAINEIDLILNNKHISKCISFDAQSIKAHCKAHLGMFQEAKNEFESLISATAEFPNIHANVLWGLAWVERALGNLEKSHELSDECIKISEPLRHYRATGLALWNLATIYRIRKDFDKACSFCIEAKKKLENIGIRSVMHILIEEAEIYRASGDYLKAKEKYLYALNLSINKIYDLDFRTHVRLGLAETNRCLEGYDESEYNECINYFHSKNVRWAYLSARIGKMIGKASILSEKLNMNEWDELYDIAKDIDFRSELNLLVLLKKEYEENYLHPLFFM